MYVHTASFTFLVQIWRLLAVSYSARIDDICNLKARLGLYRGVGGKQSILRLRIHHPARLSSVGCGLSERKTSAIFVLMAGFALIFGCFFPQVFPGALLMRRFLESCK